jgi:hypothetical protein
VTSVDPNQVLLALTSVIAAVIGAGAVVGAQHIHWKRDRAAAEVDHLQRAVEDVLVTSLSIDLRAHQLTLLATDASSVSGLLSRILGAVAPVNMSSLFETLNSEANALNRASSQVWMAGDQDTVKLTNSVVLAAMDVVEAHHATRQGNRIVRFLRELFFGRQLGDPEQVEKCRAKLAFARSDLVEHTRLTFGLPSVDLTYGTGTQDG